MRRYEYCIAAVVAVGTALGLASCSPGSSGDEAPALLEVSPSTLTFEAEESRFVEVRNAGGGTLEFSVAVSGDVDGVSWLTVEPDAGALGGGTGKSLLVSVVNRDQLKPGSYVGELTVEAEGQKTASVLVSLEVGQPLLAVDPPDTLDFGDSKTQTTLIVTNANKGKLSFSLSFPGKWLTADSSLYPVLSAGQSATYNLAVDRALVPWYGPGEEELVVTSNAPTEGASTGTRKLKVKVTVDPACNADADCTKSGYYCMLGEGTGACALRRSNGAPCAMFNECASGFCAGGICCDAACEGACVSCNLPGHPGQCLPAAKDAACDDGNPCTVTDTCQDGVCTGTEELDCSQMNTGCSAAFCVPEQGGCVNELPPGKCLIAGECFTEGEAAAGLDCRVCDPGRDTDDWSIAEGRCYFNGACFSDGEAVLGDCLLCDPAKPDRPSPASEGTACLADANPCTEDTCTGGVCKGLPLAGQGCDDGLGCTEADQCTEQGECKGQEYACSDGLACTDDHCDGAGGCDFQLLPGNCLIGGGCVAAGAEQPGSGGCSICAPESADDGWSQVAGGTPCSDADPCTTKDACQAGACVGVAKVCDDGLSCTGDACATADGNCKAAVLPGFCLIDGQCVAEGLAPESGPDRDCLVCSPALSAVGWSPHREDAPCDDGSVCSDASSCAQGTCVAEGQPCDDDNPCTLDQCAGPQECKHVNLANGIPCPEDGLDCTLDECQGGVCAHPPDAVHCLIDGQCLKQFTPHPDTTCLACQPAADPQAWTPANEGMACDDGLFCLAGDTCADGVCAGQPLQCGDQCHKGVCSDVTDECVAVPVADGKACDDLDACTVGDACLAGVCVGTDKDCAAEVELTPCTDPVCVADSFPVPGECTTQLKPSGAPCDDGKACVEGTYCNVQGLCAGGSTVTAQQCVSLLGVTGQCASAACQEPGGCAQVNVPDGTDCTLASALAKCQKGDCVLIACVDAGYGNCDGETGNGCEAKLWQDIENCGKCGMHCTYANGWPDCKAGKCSLLQCMEGYTDCDGSSANGCESNTAADPMHCGVCGNECTSANAAKVGTCVGAACQLAACPADWWNLDGSPDNGCECQYGGKELCNGYDDNCNGLVDEGFDLFSDPKNCGACGAACEDGLDHSADCLNGRCMVTACPDGFVDQNGLVDDGCEYELFHVGELWVDAANLADPLEDGSQQHPYDTVQEALAAAFPSCLVHVLPGSYSGPFLADKPGLVISGAGNDQTILSGIPAEPVLVIAASDVAVTSMLIAGGRVGVHFKGTPAAHLAGGVASDLVITGKPAPAGSGLEGAGVLVEYADGVTVSMADISSVTAGSATYGVTGYYGGNGSGVSIYWSSGTVVAGSTIASVTGAAGGASQYKAGRTGVSAGVRLDHASKAVLVGNTISAINGATGQNRPQEQHAAGATGGLAAGVFLLASADNQVSSNAFSGVIGGKGGTRWSTVGPANTQQGFGIYFNPDSLDNQVDRLNRMDGDVIVYLYGAKDESVAGLTLAGTTNPTNLGKIVVLESSNISVSGCVVKNMTGEAGQTGWDAPTYPGTAGQPIYGIRLEGCAGCQVTDNDVSGIVGGRGGVGGWWNCCDSLGGSGGKGGCISVSDSTGTAVVGNRVTGCKGGDTGAAGYGANNNGDGGDGVGYTFAASLQLLAANNQAAGIKGGWGDGTPAYANRGVCVHLDDCGPTTVGHLTCHDAGAAGGVPGVGVRIGSGQKAAVKVTNSILANIAGYGLVGLASNTALLYASYSDLFACSSGDQQNATVMAGCLSGDPLFSDPGKLVVTLLAGSPCIDKGDPASGCGNEPAPNGCRVDMGAFGNTDKATPAAAAVHCNVCPAP